MRVLPWEDGVHARVHTLSRAHPVSVRLYPEVGVINLFLRATTAALTINENADPDVRSDLWKALDAIVPGTSAADACARASFVGVSLDLPVRDGRLALGTWQGGAV